jgi:hypothetical protein
MSLTLDILEATSDLDSRLNWLGDEYRKALAKGDKHLADTHMQRITQLQQQR